MKIKNSTTFLFNLTDLISTTNNSDSDSAAWDSSEINVDFNADGFEDKAFGILGEHFGFIADAVTVHIIYCSSGVCQLPLFYQTSLGDKVSIN